MLLNYSKGKLHTYSKGKLHTYSKGKLHTNSKGKLHAYSKRKLHSHSKGKLHTDSQNESLTLIHNDIGNTMRKYKHMQCVIGGEFNLPGLNWLKEEILDGLGKSKCDLFVNMRNENGHSQHNKEISHPASNNILDPTLTNNPGSVSYVYCMPGMSDHDAVICALNILPQYKQKLKRTIYMHDKAN